MCKKYQAFLYHIRVTPRFVTNVYPKYILRSICVVYVLQYSRMKRRIQPVRLLDFFWMLGLLSGIFVFYTIAPIDSLMRGTLSDSVSIVGLTACASLPFLISATAVVFSKPWIILAISFLKAFAFSCVSLGVTVRYGNAGWLVSFFALFHEMLCLPLLYAFWHRSLASCQKPSGPECILWVSASVFAASMDYRFIIPFFSGVMIL